MNFSTLKNKLKRQSASQLLGQGTEETQLAFSFEFEAKPANPLSFKAVIKKVLAIGIVGFSLTGVVVGNMFSLSSLLLLIAIVSIVSIYRFIEGMGEFKGWNSYVQAIHRTPQLMNGGFIKRE